MKLDLRIGQKQRFALAPRLQQAIKLLQLSTGELETEIKVALESNPMLEDLSVSNVYTQFEPETYYRANNNSDDQEQENFATQEQSLQSYLAWQLNLSTFSDRDRIIASNIIDSIGEDGYLQTSVEEIRHTLQANYPDQFLQLDLIEINTVLRRIQHFDPVGVASRDLKECMLIQLEALPSTPYLNLCKKLVTNHLDLLAHKNYARIRTLMHIKDLELQSIIHSLTQLHPRPGEQISDQKIDYLTPDLIISKNNNSWHLELTKDLGVNLRVNPSYKALIKRADSSRDNNFLREQLIEARWFLNGIKNRNETLLKVASCIMNFQTDFLEHGEEKMRPMILQDIAQTVGLNESTISRITSKKYIHTPRGIYELKFFFSSYVSNDISNNCSSIAIKAIMKQLVSKEMAKKPLTDQELTELISQRGIRLSRRTVAKYREALGIKCSNQRKNS